MEVRAHIDLQTLANRMSAETGRRYDPEAAAGFLRGAGCRAEGDVWVVPVIVLGALRHSEIRIIRDGTQSQVS